VEEIVEEPKDKSDYYIKFLKGIILDPTVDYLHIKEKYFAIVILLKTID